MQYRLIRSNRKTIGLEIREGGLIVRAPQRASAEEIEKAIQAHWNWIQEHMRKSRERMESTAGIRPLTNEELQELGQRAAKYLPARIREYAARLGVNPSRVTIRAQRTRWGSCSSKGSLNFNCLLMLTPPEVIDSVVVHELCHLIEMNHSARFYREVYRVFPEYDRWHGWLREHQAELLARLG